MIHDEFPKMKITNFLQCNKPPRHCCIPGCCCPCPPPFPPCPDKVGPTGPTGPSATITPAAAVTDASSTSDIVTQFNQLLANMRTAGLLAT